MSSVIAPVHLPALVSANLHLLVNKVLAKKIHSVLSVLVAHKVVLGVLQVVLVDLEDLKAVSAVLKADLDLKVVHKVGLDHKVDLVVPKAGLVVPKVDLGVLQVVSEDLKADSEDLKADSEDLQADLVGQVHNSVRVHNSVQAHSLAALNSNPTLLFSLFVSCSKNEK
jgi:hypothetical protein